jgi:hypothetical protein
LQGFKCNKFGMNWFLFLRVHARTQGIPQCFCAAPTAISSRGVVAAFWGGAKNRLRFDSQSLTYVGRYFDLDGSARFFSFKTPRCRAQTPRITEVFGWPAKAVVSTFFGIIWNAPHHATKRVAKPQPFRLASHVAALTGTALHCKLKFLSGPLFRSHRGKNRPGSCIRSPKGETGVAGVNCLRDIFSVPPRAKAQAPAPVQKTCCLTPVEQRQSRAPVASVPGAFAPPGKEGPLFFQAHPATAACAATNKSQRRHWRLTVTTL